MPMSSARRIVVAILPPAITAALRAIRRRRTGRTSPDVQFVGSDWPITRGWDDPSVAARQRSEWWDFVEQVSSPHPVTKPSGNHGHFTIADIARHNTAMSFAYVLGLASHHLDRLSLLDWGCGLGQYAVLARALFPDLTIEYHCRELSILSREGRAVLPHDEFYDEDASSLARTYDLVVASGSLQYARDWRSTLAGLASATAGFLYVTRLPIVLLANSYVVVQRPRERYDTEYPGWVLNRDEFLEVAATVDLTLVREFPIGDQVAAFGAPEVADSRGFLFSAAGHRRS
jgi:putative methyltransferase (TIGR04325 family)